MNRTLPYATALAFGAIVTTITLLTWSVVHTLFSPYVISLAIAPLMAIGGALGVLWIAVPMKPILSYGVGAAAGLLWIPLFLQRFADPPAAMLVAGVIAFALAGRILAAMLTGIPRHAIRRDHVELLLVRSIRGVGLIFFVSIVLFPFLFMVSTSFKSRAEYLRDPVNLAFNVLQPPAQLFNGYIEVLTRFSFGRYIFNSTIIALFTVVLTLIPAILGAYAVTRLSFPGRRMLSKLILLIYMFPAIVLVIPLYSVFTQLGLRDTRHGLLIVYAAMTIPVALYMLRSYFQTLPKDLEEAGLIDGLSRLGVILRITLPLSIPAIASVGLYVFMIAWNEFLFAFMFLDTPAIFTLSRGMIMLDDQEVPRQFLMAGATVITVPIMFLFFRFQKLLVGGLTAGGVKG
jgi:multiple sugar transport system permease protein